MFSYQDLTTNIFISIVNYHWQLQSMCHLPSVQLQIHPRAILPYYYIETPHYLKSTLAPAQILFHRQIRDHLLVNPTHYCLHMDWVISSKQRVDFAHFQNQYLKEQYDCKATHELPPLSVGTNVLIHRTEKSNGGQ